MIRRFLFWLTARMKNPRVIYDRNGVSPYLSRWYLIGAPRMPDGSDPYEANGAPREGAVWPNRTFGLYIHRFHRGDDEQELHNHPWRWAVSLVLAGGYVEERRKEDWDSPKYLVVRRTVRPWTLNFVGSDDFHRVDLIEHDAWTLFLVGPKIKGWGFWDRDTGKFWPWREFITQLRDPTSHAREAAQ